MQSENMLISLLAFIETKTYFPYGCIGFKTL